MFAVSLSTMSTVFECLWIALALACGVRYLLRRATANQEQ